ncbi:MAG: SufD family Fe-S cluster assembly protein [Nanoarchaeales archaeon]|nr:SufD family Fe-S cluster assembly protein [Nanoarchaeales archaeon]
MAMLRELQRINELVAESISENNIETNLQSVEAFKTKFFESNFFSEKLTKEIFVEVTKDETLEITGCGIVNILVKQNSNLLINIQNKSTTLIRVIVEKNIKLNISEITNNKDIYKYLQIYCKENSQINFGQFILSSRVNYVKTYLEENTKYELKSGYFTNNEENFIRDEVSHLKGNSESNQKLNGASINGGKVLCDGVINIKPHAENSTGHLNISGLILDKESKIWSEPILEVENNIVSCSHGCSISQISDDIAFYMMSRGISKEQVIELVVQGYFELPLSLVKSNTQKQEIEKYLKFEL